MEKEFKIAKKDAIIIVDVQRDFCPGGALPVPQGDQVVPIINEYINQFTAMNARIFATRDWHPPNHVSFKTQGGPWPPHCIRESEGAKFHPDLELPEDTVVISKAMDPAKESYSGFDGTKLADELGKNEVKRIFVGGLATDYCVKSTVLDGIKLGFETVLLVDAIRGINVAPGDADKAVEEMVAAGAEKATMADFTEPEEVLSEDQESETIDDKPLARAETKKIARLRSRGPYRKIRSER